MSRWSLVMVTVFLSQAPLAAQPLPVGKLRYLRPAGDSWATDCVFTIAKKGEGWSIAGATERGALKLTLETRYRPKDVLEASVLTVRNGDKESLAIAACLQEGVARVQLPEQPLKMVDVPRGVIVTSAPDWTDVLLLCARYEGVDQRFIDSYVDVQLSLGDFVLSGGEIAAMALLDAVARLQPGVLNDAGSHQEDSFNPALDGLLDCPHYTRPEEWNGLGVPEELVSGHHARIAAWRREQRLALTARHRPDLIAAARQAGRLTRADEDFLAGL